MFNHSIITSVRSLVKKTIKAELLEFAQLADEPYHNNVLDQYLQEINAAHFHAFQAGGKLIRPVLVALMAGSFGGSNGLSNSLTAAAAVECVHTFSLVHDDLPCMDNDSLRRGQPTVHVVYGHAKGLLVGDGLLAAAFSMLSGSRSITHEVPARNELIVELVKYLSQSIGIKGMIWGQWLDISESEFLQNLNTQDSQIIWDVFKTIHNNKTGQLFAASIVMGMLCGVFVQNDSLHSLKTQQLKNEMWKIGLDIGFVFQVLDDILDVTKSTEQLGKTAAKDLRQDKLTSVSILGVEKSREYAVQLMSTTIASLQTLINSYVTNQTHEAREYFDSLIMLLDQMTNRDF